MLDVKNMEVVVEYEGKEITRFKYSVKPPTTITEEQLALLDTLINEQAKDLKYHANNHGWDVTTDIYEGEVLDEFFGTFDFMTYIRARIAKKAKCNILYDKGTKFRPSKEKVIYDPINDELYIDISLRDVNNDVMLGEL